MSQRFVSGTKHKMDSGTSEVNGRFSTIFNPGCMSNESNHFVKEKIFRHIKHTEKHTSYPCKLEVK